ncbi:MAG: hypothetical protein PHC28_09525 [Flavobacterium sp.]|uniref:hypothetical protein n=1 Tax=Flavobacterium sp. TaxID=239 RepID=UPI00260B5E9D|nr:hypothetical protein [Flavobacterium sp.]MDD5150696.1 hypothetical protein [Flavobacterium sp.]
MTVFTIIGALVGLLSGGHWIIGSVCGFIFGIFVNLMMSGSSSSNSCIDLSDFYGFDD